MRERERERESQTETARERERARGYVGREKRLGCFHLTTYNITYRLFQEKFVLGLREEGKTPGLVSCTREQNNIGLLHNKPPFLEMASWINVQHIMIIDRGA